MTDIESILRAAEKTGGKVLADKIRAIIDAGHSFPINILHALKMDGIGRRTAQFLEDSGLVLDTLPANQKWMTPLSERAWNSIDRHKLCDRQDALRYFSNSNFIPLRGMGAKSVTEILRALGLPEKTDSRCRCPACGQCIKK